MKYIQLTGFLKMNFINNGLNESLLGGSGSKEKSSLPTLPEKQKQPVIDGSKIARHELSLDVLQTISNKQFLELPLEKRLPHITHGNTHFDQVAKGEVKNLSFTFTFDGVFNKELYMKTTAGQVLPPEVSSVTIGGEVYSRKGVSGEFFTQNNKRLIIQEGTRLEISELRTQNEMKEITQENEKSVQNFLKEYPSAQTEIVQEAIQRNIDPKFALLAFSDAYKNAPDGEKKGVLEDMMTQFDRYRGYHEIAAELKDGKYDASLALALFTEFNKNSWKQKAQEYGISQTQITDFESKGERFMSLGANDIENNDSLPDGTYLKGKALLENPAFAQKLDAVCANLGVDKKHMIQIMWAESGMDSRNVNKGSGATGLIQFMPPTAESLGTSVGNLRRMTAVEQLDYVEKYFRKNSAGFALDSVVALYKVVFFPAALGKSDEWVFDAKDAPAHKVAAQNRGIAKFSQRSDGLIDGHTFASYVNNHVSKFA